MTGSGRDPLGFEFSTAAAHCPPQAEHVEGFVDGSKTRAQKHRIEADLGLQRSGAVGVQEVGSSNLLGPTIHNSNVFGGLGQPPAVTRPRLASSST